MSSSISAPASARCSTSACSPMAPSGRRSSPPRAMPAESNASFPDRRASGRAALSALPRSKPRRATPSDRTADPCRWMSRCSSSAITTARPLPASRLPACRARRRAGRGHDGRRLACGGRGTRRRTLGRREARDRDRWIVDRLTTALMDQRFRCGGYAARARRPLDRQVGRLRACENANDMDRETTRHRPAIGSIRHQPTGFVGARTADAPRVVNARLWVRGRRPGRGSRIAATFTKCLRSPDLPRTRRPCRAGVRAHAAPRSSDLSTAGPPVDIRFSRPLLLQWLTRGNADMAFGRRLAIMG